jgi:hypothetical protein
MIQNNNKEHRLKYVSSITSNSVPFSSSLHVICGDLQNKEGKIFMNPTLRVKAGSKQSWQIIPTCIFYLLCICECVTTCNTVYYWRSRFKDQQLVPPLIYVSTYITLLLLVVCILLRVLGQVQGFRLTQHCFESLFSILFNNRITEYIYI